MLGFKTFSFPSGQGSGLMFPVESAGVVVVPDDLFTSFLQTSLPILPSPNSSCTVHLGNRQGMRSWDISTTDFAQC
jgi:hypothetical protein